jgi:hypothetical protein
VATRSPVVSKNKNSTRNSTTADEVTRTRGSGLTSETGPNELPREGAAARGEEGREEKAEKFRARLTVARSGLAQDTEPR